MLLNRIYTGQHKLLSSSHHGLGQEAVTRMFLIHHLFESQSCLDTGFPVLGFQVQSVCVGVGGWGGVFSVGLLTFRFLLAIAFIDWSLHWSVFMCIHASVACVYVTLCVCVCVCMPACVRACVHACVWIDMCVNTSSESPPDWL